MRIVALVFGGLLCVSLLVLIVYYFSPSRKQRVESPKYSILEDEDKTENN